MDSLMMDRPLQLKTLLWRAERLFGHKQIITRHDDGYRRYTYAEFGKRVRRLADALNRLGVRTGDRVGTLGWNTDQHYEAYFAVPCMGAVLHTINIRLSPDQIGYVIEHAGDSVLLVSPEQLPMLEQIRDRLTNVKAVVVFGDGQPPTTALGPVYGYEELLADADEEIEFPDVDEDSPAGMCYTSGTTGEPKGVVYSHRSTVLHALILCLQGSIGVAERETYLLVTPMSHVNSWGMPYACALQGASLALPGTQPRPHHYLEIIEHARVSVCVAAVTVGMLMRQELESGRQSYVLDSLHTLWLGGQAPPIGEIRWWQQAHGVHVCQGWGMTEASPLLTFTTLTSQFTDLDDEGKFRLLGTQGQPMPLVEIKLVDDHGEELPWDGKHAGEILARSPWVARAYYHDTRSQDSFAGGWFHTGDVGVIDQNGYLWLVDRVKDLIKSGGEWISSVDLENALMGHPEVREAAVVAAPDPVWLERPIAIVATNSPVASDDLTEFLREKFPKFWLPDRFVFVDEVPKTGVGKFNKKLLRKQIAAGNNHSTDKTP
ncbi:fatty-acyl-CoA synthase [Saccharomonospora amisosensis]|uniref:Fatty-acyl-CoA synthase n=1 Tax=Saccharomonospora amisosensis TaxID=1128677 RepID=A0A7X5UL74_9PSEU|nr:long-chain fatty acid--CoA ligase [Saccharomonospora amisosensis]NIJ09733.1 fatty-acyl-CoA synthase [Saccharomonospora amisosensis]